VVFYAMAEALALQRIEMREEMRKHVSKERDELRDELRKEIDSLRVERGSNIELIKRGQRNVG
jgi:hypothetical protein